MKTTLQSILASLLFCGALCAEADPYVLYVGPSGNDANTGLSSNEARLTINSALATMEAYADIDAVGGTIYLLDGTYSLDTAMSDTSAIVLSHPVAIEGLSRDASKVVIRRSTGTFRIFYLNHADAAVRFLTISSGNSGSNAGGGFYIDSNGGSVEDCIITGCTAGNVSGQPGGGGGYMAAGRLLRSIVTNCTVGNMRRYGAGIYATGGTIDNCLITSCRTSHHASSCNGNAAVCLLGSAKMVNSTVSKNTSCLVTGVWIGSTSAQAVNCAVYGNTLCTSSHSDGVTRFNGCFVNLSVGNTTIKPAHATGKGDLYVYCASESEPYTASCIQLVESPFVDYVNGDYSHVLSSPLANAGDSQLARSLSTSAKDLFGNERYSGTHVDIGAFELPQGFSVSGVADKTSVVLSEGGEVTFTAESSGASGPVTYIWDFGDESSMVSTTESSVVHEYVAGGTYTVVVSANDGIQTVSYTFLSPISVYAISFACTASPLSVVTNGTVHFAVADVLTENAMTYTWNFGDGHTSVSTETQVSHIYENVGEYMVTCSGASSVGESYVYVFADPIVVVPKDLYVDSSSTNGRKPYSSWSIAGNKISTVLSYAAEGCVIHLKAGTYNNDKASDIKVDKAVTIIGEGETPADVVIPGNANDSGNRNMSVTAEGALVCNLTLYGGFAGQSSGGGGNLYLSGGSVSNCVLSSGRSHNNGSEAGGAKVIGGLLTHCIITNSWNRNRGNGIVLVQTAGRVSNCLITRNWKSFDTSRNAISLVSISGGVMDNCTIAKCWIMYNTQQGKYQVTDKAVNVTGSGKAYNVAIADINYVGYDSATDKVVDWPDATPRRWDGAAANFVNCATDDAEPINGTCRTGTTETFFTDYAAGDLTPKMGGALFGKGIAVAGQPAVDLAGQPRVSGSTIDIGCYENQLNPRTIILLR